MKTISQETGNIQENNVETGIKTASPLCTEYQPPPNIHEHFDRPPISLEWWPPSLREIGENMAAAYQVPASLPLMSMLAFYGGALGKSTHVVGACRNFQTRLNPYVVAVALPSSGKDVVGGMLAKPIEARSLELAKDHTKVIADNRAEQGWLKKQIQMLEGKTSTLKGDAYKDAISNLKEKQLRLMELEKESKRNVTLITNNSTGEALGRDLADNNETLLNYSPEAGAGIKVALGKYNDGDGGDFDLYLAGYSGGQVKVSRMTRKVDLQSPCLSLLWMIQPYVVSSLINNAEVRGRGLTARMLLFDSGARPQRDNGEVNPFLFSEKWMQMINRCLDRRLANDVREITCTAAARKVFAEFHNESVALGEGKFADLQSEFGRYRENAIKVGGVFADVQDRREISEAIAMQAVSLVRWTGQNYLAMLQAGRADGVKKEVEILTRHLRDAGGELNLGKLHTHHGFDRQRVEFVCANSRGQIVAERRKSPGPGQPAIIVRLQNESSDSSE